MRRQLLALVSLSSLATAAAGAAGAQIIRRPPGMSFQEPAAWVSFGAALTQGFTVPDGTTHSTWDFGSGTQYSVTLEKSLAGGASVGVRGMTSRMPLRYTALVGGDATLVTDADANVSSLEAMLHLATGREFHTVLELGIGATLYSNFHERGNDAKLAPDNDADFTFRFGYGVGYAFSPTFSVDVVQDISTAVHQKTGLSAGEDTSVRFNATRLVARFGLGSR